MNTTIMVGAVSVVLVYYYYTRKKKPPKVTPAQKPRSEPTTRSRTKETGEKKDLYKKKSIRVFDIKGTNHRDLNKSEHTGAFIGYAQAENNPHDRYAVGLFNDSGVRLGYVPKGNTRLHNSLDEWYDGKSLAWGHMEYDDYLKKWLGKVFIPVKYSAGEVAKIQEVLTLRALNDPAIPKKDKTTEEYFQILERHKQIKKNLDELKKPRELSYTFSKNIIPSLSKHLEKQKEWNKLVELEAYQDLINDLSEQYKGATERRIALAKSHL